VKESFFWVGSFQ